MLIFQSSIAMPIPGLQYCIAIQNSKTCSSLACSALFKEIRDYLGSRGVGCTWCTIEEDYKNLDQQTDQENREQDPVLYNLYTPN